MNFIIFFFKEKSTLIFHFHFHWDDWKKNDTSQPGKLLSIKKNLEEPKLLEIFSFEISFPLLFFPFSLVKYFFQKKMSKFSFFFYSINVIFIVAMNVWRFSIPNGWIYTKIRPDYAVLKKINCTGSDFFYAQYTHTHPIWN